MGHNQPMPTLADECNEGLVIGPRDGDGDEAAMSTPSPIFAPKALGDEPSALLEQRSATLESLQSILTDRQQTFTKPNSRP